MSKQKNDNTVDWWNKRYSTNDAHKTWSSQKRIRFYDMIATAIPKETATILDVGSGFGFGPSHMMDVCSNWKIDGLDFSTKACKEAMVKTHCVNIITDNLPGEYDYIIAAETLEHFCNPMTILTKLYKAAKIAVILTVPHMGGISAMHISSFNRKSFDKYTNVTTKLSDDKHFMLVIIPKTNSG